MLMLVAPLNTRPKIDSVQPSYAFPNTAMRHGLSSSSCVHDALLNIQEQGVLSFSKCFSLLVLTLMPLAATAKIFEVISI
jgi:hypothetical protein